MNKIQIKHIHYKVGRTQKGYWSTKKMDYSEVAVSTEYYKRFIKNLWADDRVSYTYTPFGYTPYKITNISPCGSLRAVHEFEFEYMK